MRNSSVSLVTGQRDKRRKNRGSIPDTGYRLLISSPCSTNHRPMRPKFRKRGAIPSIPYTCSRCCKVDPMTLHLRYKQLSVMFLTPVHTHITVWPEEGSRGLHETFVLTTTVTTFPRWHSHHVFISVFTTGQNFSFWPRRLQSTPYHHISPKFHFNIIPHLCLGSKGKHKQNRSIHS